MSDKSLEKLLAEMFESELREFFSLPVIDRLEKAKQLFRFKNKKFYLALEKLSEIIVRDVENKTLKEKEIYFHDLDARLKYYLDRELQSTLFHLPYFLWVSHIIFDNTHSFLTYEEKEEIRRKSNLDKPKKRADACKDFFYGLVKENVVDGGSQTLWNKWTRLYFLSLYEKFSIVIANARKDKELLKKQKVAVMDMRKEILEKYHIPENLWSDVAKNTKTIDKFARKWASDKIQKEIKKELLEKMGFSDSYLIKVLEKARKEVKIDIPCNCKNYENHKLIFLTFGNPDFAQKIFTLNKSDLKELKFDSFIENEYHGMTLHFIE